MAVFTVTNLLDSGVGSLRDAIAKSNARFGNDTINFAPELSGTIRLLTGQFLLTDSVEISSPGAEKITIDAQEQSRIFYIDDAENLAIEVALNGLTLTGGRALDGISQGGAILNRGRHLQISNSVISENSAVGDDIASGGAIANIGTFIKSEALASVLPGGLMITPANLTLLNSTVSSNTSRASSYGATAEGGAIFSLFQGDIQTAEPFTDSDRERLIENQNKISILGSSVVDNTVNASSTASGGGISSYYSSIEIEDSTIASNAIFSAGWTEGGGLAAYASQVNIRNSTLASNELNSPSFNAGGGIFSFDSELLINNSTITGNAANTDGSEAIGYSIGGGIAISLDSTVILNSSIVAENLAQHNPDIDIEVRGNTYAPLTGSFNLIGTAKDEFFPLVNGVDGNLVGTVENPISPQLGPLQSNGGATQTRALLPNSPAIDAGADHLELGGDQRGPDFLRSVGQTDIGAFEIQPAATVPVVLNQNLYGSADDDVLIGGQGDDRLYGNGGQDVLVGEQGDDQLYGAANGNETFDGGLGNDEMWLNGGYDQIILSTNSGVDTIHGFQSNQSQFVLSDGLTFADLSFAQQDGFSEILLDADVLARVNWTSVDQLACSSNFAAL